MAETPESHLPLPVSGNVLRAAVLGANDGLVSNLSLVMGVTGAALAQSDVIITGIAGLLAGAGSMAMGEWLSVQSSRELNQYLVEIEADELETDPTGEFEELVSILETKAIPPPQARVIARQLMRTPEAALETHAREELGIDPEELGGSAYSAAATSFVLFVLGAVIPVVPLFFFERWTATLASLGLSTVGLFAMGTTITYLTGRNPVWSGLRQVLIGLGAAALIYGVGYLVGTTVLASV